MIPVMVFLESNHYKSSSTLIDVMVVVETMDAALIFLPSTPIFRLRRFLTDGFIQMYMIASLR